MDEQIKEIPEVQQTQEVLQEETVKGSLSWGPSGSDKPTPAWVDVAFNAILEIVTIANLVMGGWSDIDANTKVHILEGSAAAILALRRLAKWFHVKIKDDQ